jgi:hypothetical protein
MPQLHAQNSTRIGILWARCDILWKQFSLNDVAETVENDISWSQRTNKYAALYQLGNAAIESPGQALLACTRPLRRTPP